MVAFKDVQELQTRNSELLMVIREVTAKQEASEAKLVEERTADLKKVIAIFLRDHPFKTSACLRGEGCPHGPMVKRSQYKWIKNPLQKHFDGMPMLGG